AGWCDISWLYSTQDVSGVGTALMTKVEVFATEHDCKGMLVDTLEYQAPAFYKKFGFEAYGQIPDFISNQTRTFFMKRL
ncbi:MAG: GNAT family N-acetyltransferase, partial [Bdellovibrionales bacterium]